MMENKKQMKRRTFLKSASFLAAAPCVVPISALGRDGFVAPSERILLAGIGINSRGTTDMQMLLREKDVQFVAICDLRKERQIAVKNMADAHHGTKDCAMFGNIHEFLAARPDVDATLIATGDRWHAQASILAMRAGKDVYSEKPSSMTIAEGQAVLATSQRYGRVYQTGAQRLSEANFIFCNEMLRTGRLGKVDTIRAHIAPWDAAEMRHDWLPAQPEPPKDEVDWDAWLGPCPWRPYNRTYVTGGWRGHYDFHTSCIGEWGAHTFAQCAEAIGGTKSSAIHYGYVENESGDHMVATFGDDLTTECAKNVKMVLERDMDNEYWHGSCGVRYEGEHGWVSSADGYAKPDTSSPEMLADYKKIVSDYLARTGRSLGHWRDFVDCVKSRRTTVANAEVMHRSMSTVHAANICMWLKRDLRFDPKTEDFVNDTEASRLCSRAQREPWII